MKKLRQFFMWILLLNKRLFKKPGFLVILVMIPLLVLAVDLIGDEDSGALTVALSIEDSDDPLATEIVKSLTDSSRLIRFIECNDPDDAKELVENGTSDAAWIFHEDLEKKIDKFTKNIHQRNAFVTVIQREETILLQLSREKLYAALYPHTAFSLYKNYIIYDIPEIGELSEDQFRNYYDTIDAEGEDLFKFSYADPNESTEDAENMSYLLAPMRGLLSVLVILGGFAVAMFYMQDENAGKFDWIPQHRRPMFAVIYNMTAIADIALAALLAILLSGLSVSIAREILLMLIYTVLSTGFCIAIKQICGSIHRLGAIIPVMIVAMVALCPVFFNTTGLLRNFSYLLPPFYYLNAVHNTNFIPPMLIYTFAIYAFNFVFYKIKTHP